MAYGVGLSGVRAFIKGVLGVNELQARHVSEVIRYIKEYSGGHSCAQLSGAAASATPKAGEREAASSAGKRAKSASRSASSAMSTERAGRTASSDSASKAKTVKK